MSLDRKAFDAVRRMSLPAGRLPCLTSLSLQASLPAALLAVVLVLLAVSGCGNKGALYLEPDSESRAQLEQAEREINQAAGVSVDESADETDKAADDDEDEKPVKKLAN